MKSLLFSSIVKSQIRSLKKLEAACNRKEQTPQDLYLKHAGHFITSNLKILTVPRIIFPTKMPTMEGTHRTRPPRLSSTKTLFRSYRFDIPFRTQQAPRLAIENNHQLTSGKTSILRGHAAKDGGPTRSRNTGSRNKISYGQHRFTDTRAGFRVPKLQ